MYSMDYTYLLEENVRYIDDTTDIHVLYLLCYNVNMNCKYPFLQFLMDKNLEELTLPYIIINNTDCDILSETTEIVKKRMFIMNLNKGFNKGFNKGVIDYKGVIEYGGKYYALININNYNVSGLNLQRHSPYWFVLPSEIICIKKVCNVPINESVVSLFINNPQISLLTNPKTHGVYIIPDTVYSIGSIKTIEYNSIFGNQKTKPYDGCDEYYFFYRSFKDVLTNIDTNVNDTNVNDTNVNDTNVNDTNVNDTNVNDNIGFNRYALFVEGGLYLEENREFKLTKEQIMDEYPEPCVIICYLKDHNMKPDMLVKESDSFDCISYYTNMREYENK
jgi:hypothetical protein